jgi:hypothetical protein
LNRAAQPKRPESYYHPEDILDRQVRIDCSKGCFIVYSVSADGLNDKNTRKHIRTYLDNFEYALEKASWDAVRNKELEASIDLSKTAAVITDPYLETLAGVVAGRLPLTTISRIRTSMRNLLCC